LLWINTALDVLYVAGGLILALAFGSRGMDWQGHGWGIVVQGAFLFLFDLIHAQSVPVSIDAEVPAALRGPEHLPFLWEEGRPAALLVHGFPGTPLEMRPLGELLRQAGWTVHGLLLPGFGPQTDTLHRRRYEDWLGAVQDALRALRRDHGPVLLVGYSMGAALALSAATSDPPDGLVVLAPFLELGSRLQRSIATLLGPFLPRTLRPLRKVDFADAQLRQAITKYMPGIDLDDPQTQQEIRDLAIPVSLLAQVSKAGQEALRRAASLETPTVIVQGRRDQVVGLRSTDRLVRRLRCDHRYEVVDADHDLVDAGGESWGAVQQLVLGFADSLLGTKSECTTCRP